MGFVQSAFWVSLAALSVPILVHLIFRWQTRQVDLGSIRFLAEILQRNARRRKLKRWLLLAMRMACVALLAGLFMRPYLLTSRVSSGEKTLVILIDQSASMELRSGGVRLIDRAVDRARDIVRESGDDTHWEIAFFDHTLHPFGSQADATDRTDTPSLDDLEAPSRLYHATDYGTAMSWAHDRCVASRVGRKDVYILTDAQRSGFDWTTTDAFPDDVTVHLEDLGKPLVNNVAVISAEPSRRIVRTGEGVVVDVGVMNFGPFDLEEVSVVLNLQAGNRKHRLAETIAARPGQVERVVFEVPALQDGLWSGAVEVEIEDELGFDNRRHLAVLAAPQERVLLVDGAEADSALFSETLYLEAAVGLAPRGKSYAACPFVAEVVSFEQTGLPRLDNTRLVVLANVPKLSSSEVRRLDDFVRGGGGLLVFTGERMTHDSTSALTEDGLIPATLGEPVHARDLPFRWQSWDEANPLFEPFRDPQYGDLRGLSVQTYTSLQPAADADVLATFGDESPALVGADVGDGRVLLFPSTANRGWNDLPRNRLFVPLVHQMLKELLGRNGEGPVRTLVLDAEHADADSSLLPGVHQQDDHWLVVNVSPREAETDRCTASDFAERFEVPVLSTTEDAAAAPQVASAVNIDLREHELWQWVALVLLVLVAGEAFLANRSVA